MSKPVEGGAVLLARALTDSDVWRQPASFIKLWVYILTKARWSRKPREVGGVTLGYGELLKSYRVIAEENAWVENRRERRWSNSMIGRMLEWFEAEGMIRCNGTDLGTLIHVHNFKRYQDFATYAADHGTGLGTTEGQQRDNKKQVQAGSVGSGSSGDAPKFSTDPTEEKASGVIMHANLAMTENATIDQNRLRPISPTHGSRSVVVEWLTEGIPSELIYEVVGDVARTAAMSNGDGIRSMLFFNRAVRNAWAEDEAMKAMQQHKPDGGNDAKVVRLDQRTPRRGGRPSGPRRWESVTPTERFDPDAAAS